MLSALCGQARYVASGLMQRIIGRVSGRPDFPPACGVRQRPPPGGFVLTDHPEATDQSRPRGSVPL